MVRCCLIGPYKDYRYKNEIKEKLREKIIELIEQHGITEFWVKNCGNFDYCVGEILCELKKQYPHIQRFLVLLPANTEYRRDKNYDKDKFEHIFTALIPGNMPYSYSMLKTNEFMLQLSAHLICHGVHDWSGAAKTLEFAEKNEIEIHDLK